MTKKLDVGRPVRPKSDFNGGEIGNVVCYLKLLITDLMLSYQMFPPFYKSVD
jgi:hypothetical protein